MKFTHSFGKITYIVSPKLWKSHIFILISTKRDKLFLLKFTLFDHYKFLACKLFGPKLRLCKIFDKFHFCCQVDNMTQYRCVFWTTCCTNNSSVSISNSWKLLHTFKDDFINVVLRLFTSQRKSWIGIILQNTDPLFRFREGVKNW